MAREPATAGGLATLAPHEIDDVLDRFGWDESQILELMDQSYEDHAAFCRRMTIRDKRGVAVPVELTPAQIKLHAACQKQRSVGHPVRLCVLKPRQVHMSVGVATEIFRRVAFLPGQHALIYGDVYDSACNIWGYYDQFSGSYRPGLHGVAQRAVIGRCKGESIDWEGGSYIDVRSAQNANSGRSASVRFLNNSESGFWRDAQTLRTGLLQCVPDDPDTMVIDESTANGVGGSFYDQVQRIRGGEMIDWLFLFFAWWEHPEYVRRLDISRERFEASLSAEEREIQAAYRLSFEQLNWRRWAISDKCEGHVDRFRQEYPSNPEEAFLSSGRPRFSVVDLGRQALCLNREPMIGALEEQLIGTRRQPVFLPRPQGELWLFKRPALNKRYVIGADTAEGIDALEGKGGSVDPDWSAGYVADEDTGEEVALLRARMEPAPFGEYLWLLGRWYNWAFLVPEANGPGLAVIEELLRRQYPLHLIYHRHRAPDDQKTAELRELGWKTTTVSRPQLISAQDRALQDGSIVIRDTVTLQEHRTFVIWPSGKAAAQAGCHDDCVIAAALATIGLQVAPTVRRQMERLGPRRPPEDDEDEKPQAFNYRGARRRR